MQLISRSDVVISADRQRKEFNETRLRALARSISSKGLMKPIVLQSDRKTLIAGERRLRALMILEKEGRAFFEHNAQMCPITNVPYVILSEMSLTDIFEAEYEENHLAENLTWQETIAAQAKLHQLRLVDNPEQTAVATATELVKLEQRTSGKILDEDKEKNRIMVEASNVRDSMILEKFMDDEDVMSATNKKDALKIAMNKMRTTFNKKLAETAAAELKDKPRSERYVLLEGEAEECLGRIPDASIDLILTDPPYGVGADNFNGIHKQLAHGYEDSPEYFRELFPKIAVHWSRLIKNEGHLFMFFDFDHYEFICQWLSNTGWKVINQPLIWDKGYVSQTDSTRYFPNQYEPILMAVRGDKKLIKSGTNILRVVGPRDKVHPAQKPIELYAEIISRTCHPGSVVLDSFAGSGPVFPAAAANLCKAIGIERDKTSQMLCKAQINKLGG